MSLSGITTPGKYEKIMEGVGVWGAYYRANPNRLVKDYFGIHWLSPFQQILLCFFLRFTYAMVIASRGMGKTLIMAVAICVKCVLYPDCRVVIAAGNRGQSLNVLKKIVEDLMPASENLRNEITEFRTTVSDAHIYWRSGAVVEVVTARDSARSARANWLICDEFVQIPQVIISSVLRKFKAGKRRPGFLDKEEYRNYPVEPNSESYISSAYLKAHYSWGKFKSYFKSMAKGEDYICCGLPYQLPVRAGYYPKEQIAEEMQESDFDPISWSMEMDSMFLGEVANAYFNYNAMNVNRTMELPVYPRSVYQMLGDPKIKYRNKEVDEIRILAMDVAVMGGNKNDNTCYSILSLKPNKYSQYVRRLIYLETRNGGHSEDQAIRLRQLFDDFESDYIVLDTQGVGLGVYDQLTRELFDPERNLIYQPITCMNDPEMAARCKDDNALPVIYSVKATPQWNSDAAVSMKDCLTRGLLKLLISEIDAADIWSENKNYMFLDPQQQALIKMPYHQTTLLVSEMINLSFELVNGKIRIFEGNGRKDRYSSVSYGNAFANELERTNLRTPKSRNDEIQTAFRTPDFHRRTGGLVRRWR